MWQDVLNATGCVSAEDRDVIRRMMSKLRTKFTKWDFEWVYEYLKWVYEYFEWVYEWL